MAVLLFAWYCRQNNIHNDRRQAIQCPPSVCYGASTVGRAADCSGHVRVHVGRITIRTTCATVAPVVVAVAIGESRIVTLCRIAAATSAVAAATRIAMCKLITDSPFRRHRFGQQQNLQTPKVLALFRRCIKVVQNDRELPVRPGVPP